MRIKDVLRLLRQAVLLGGSWVWGGVRDGIGSAESYRLAPHTYECTLCMKQSMGVRCRIGVKKKDEKKSLSQGLSLSLSLSR